MIIRTDEPIAACHGGHCEVAESLLERGADVDWAGWDDLTPLDTARCGHGKEIVTWLRRVGAKSVTEVGRAR